VCFLGRWIVSDNKDESLTDDYIVCIHLPHQGYSSSGLVYRYFTGVKNEFYFICGDCAKNLNPSDYRLHTISQAEFRKTHLSVGETTIVGELEYPTRETDLFFKHTICQLDSIASKRIYAVAPRHHIDDDWLLLLSTGELILLNSIARTEQVVAVFKESDLALTEKMRLYVSPNDQFVVIVNDFSTDGLVFDIKTGLVTMKLQRDSYYEEQTYFPIAFFQHKSRVLLIHGTEWNRLDISDPLTGELLTQRAPFDENGNKRSIHYLDYFHSRLRISPDNEWVVEDGWIWHPFGSVRLWNVKQWLLNNVWESEDGVSVCGFADCSYYWDRPLCWIDSTTLACWGIPIAEDFGPLDPGIYLIDATSCTESSRFWGPSEGDIYWDDVLVVVSKHGTDIWDIKTGERLLRVSDLHPLNFNPITHQFLSILDGNILKFSQIQGHV
jgi:hypothetical protein